MDVIYNKNADLDEENNFSIYLTASNENDGVIFKNKEEYLISGLEIKKQPVDLTKWNEFSTIKKISDRINKAKKDKENEIKHGQILVYLPSFNNFEEDTLIAEGPPKKIYKYINAETKNIDMIEFPDYKKWYETKGAVWNSSRNKNAYKYMFEKYNNKETSRNIIKKKK